MASTKPTTPPRKLKLTKTTVAELPKPADKVAVYWDTATSGLGLRISSKDRRTYFLQTRTGAGKGVKITLGTADRITPDQAREAAKKHAAAIALDRDPAAERRAKREAERERRRQAKAEEQAATVADLWQAFQAEHVSTLRPKSQDAYAAWYKLHIAPALGATKLRDLTRGKIEVMLRAVAAGSGKSTSNRVQAVISAMLSFGEGATDATGERRRFPDTINCARGIKRHAEPGREREFSDDELARLIAYLEASSALEARLLELALATGARRNEMLHMSWSEINGGWWVIPAERSKSRRKQRKPLSAAALAVLAKLDKRCDPFAGTSASRLSRWWLVARAELKLKDVHLHDLRHAAASLAISAGVPLAAVGALLGHGVNSAAMTARYSHLADAQLTRAGEAVAEQLKLLREVRPAGTA